MFHYVFKRLAVMAPTLLVISFIIFVIVSLPPTHSTTRISGNTQ